MEFDFSTILYIVFGLLYFLFTGAARSKKRRQNQQPPTSTRPEDATETLGPPPVTRRPTFEELLEEFTTGKKPEPEPVLAQPEVVEVEPVVEESKSINKYMQALEDRKTRKEHPSEPAEFTRFEEFEQEETVANPYAAIMRQPDGAKKAFILSEIFNRKY